MSNVSYLRTPTGARRQGLRAPGGSGVSPRRHRGRWLVGGFVLLVLVVLAVAAVVFGTAKASLTGDPNALAKVSLPAAGGEIKSVSVVTGPHAAAVPVRVTDAHRLMPRKTVAAGSKLQVRVVVSHPGWISWLSGKTETLTRTVTVPAAQLRSHFVTLDKSGALRIHFARPVRVIAFGSQRGQLTRRTLSGPRTTVALPHTGTAGTTFVAAQVHPYETSDAEAVSYFPAGTKASVVASPAPGAQIKPGTPITLTFSKPVSQALGSHLPAVSPQTTGSWHQISAHAIQYRPSGYGWGLDQKVSIPLPTGVQLAGAQTASGASTGTWSVPGGSTVRLQQILAVLGYLPLNFHYAGGGPGATLAAQEDAAVNAPKGSFDWTWGNTPDALKTFWKPGTLGTLEQGAIMKFENDHDMTSDGIAGPAVWKALINAMVHHQRNTFGYTFVSVSVSSQSLSLWHNGRTVIGGTAVNTGASGTPTATGTYPVFEHIPETTMSGTNPDGSHYSDPGIKYVSYFHGGDALHAFTRAQYGSPQSLGCVEMPLGPAGQVYPYTPIGTLVHVA